MKKCIYWMLSLLVALAVYGCETDEPEAGAQGNDVFPFLKTGNTWIYNYSIDGQTPMLFEQKILGTDDLGYFEIETTLLEITHTEYRWEATDTYFTDIPTFPLYYKNGNVGKKWNASEVDEDLGTMTREIVATSETVIVPAGTFTKCQKVKQTFEADANVVYYYWISPDAGLVKQESIGWAEMDDETLYFDILLELKSKNF